MHSKELTSDGVGQIVPKLNTSDGTAAVSRSTRLTIPDGRDASGSGSALRQLSDSTYLQPTPVLDPPPGPGPVQVPGDRHHGNRLEALLPQRKSDPAYLHPTPVLANRHFLPVVNGLALTALNAPSAPKHSTTGVPIASLSCEHADRSSPEAAADDLSAPRANGDDGNEATEQDAARNREPPGHEGH